MCQILNFADYTEYLVKISTEYSLTAPPLPEFLPPPKIKCILCSIGQIFNTFFKCPDWYAKVVKLSAGQWLKMATFMCFNLTLTLLMKSGLSIIFHCILTLSLCAYRKTWLTPISNNRKTNDQTFLHGRFKRIIHIEAWNVLIAEIVTPKSSVSFKECCLKLSNADLSMY